MADMEGYGLGANDGIRDDPDRNPSDLRFGVGNLVMFKSDDGWFDGEVVKVSQRLVIGPRSQYIAYIIWPIRDREDADLGTEWAMEDTDEFIKPRQEDLTPDPSKFKPLLVAPNDPMHSLYTDAKKYDCTTEEGDNMADVFEKLNMVDKAKTNPDGSVDVKGKDGRRVTTATIEIPKEPICGIDAFTAIMFASNQVATRQRANSNPTRLPDLVEIFKSIVPIETSLAHLERAAKSSSSKMLQLADCLMTGINGWTRDPRRACNLYRAAAWGCTEEEESSRTGIPNGVPEAMIAAASLGISFLKNSLGYQPNDNCPFREWLEQGLSTEQGLGILHQIFYWTVTAMSLHGWVTSLTLMIANTIDDINFINDRRLAGEAGDDLKSMCESLLCAKEYREKELVFEDMHRKGTFPRGDPSSSVIELFRTKALEIFQNLPKTDETMHIEFKQVPRPPFSMIAIAFLPSQRRIVKIVRLPDTLQMMPFSIESFQYVWLLIAFDIHLGRLGTNERVRPVVFTVPDTHGNHAFASFLEQMLKDSDTKVQRVSHADPIKTGKRTRTPLGQLVSEVMAIFLDIPGFLFDDDSTNDIVARAQEDFVDRIITQEMSGIENEDDATHFQASEQMKQRGNQYFQANEFNAAVRCYAIALGHMRRIVEHSQTTHKLLGTILSNRAACFLSLLETQHSLEFRKVLARNAINDCTAALESSWASSSLSHSILEKLRFRRDKASASYDSLNAGDYSVAEILFPNSNTNEAGIDRVSTLAADDAEGLQSGSPRHSHSELGEKNTNDAVMEYGEILFKNDLAKNAKDGCPICMREFSGELWKTYAVVLPCGEHALCANCTCSLKITADKAKQLPQCPLCRYSFDPEFIEVLPSQMIEKDEEIAKLIVKLPTMELDEKIAIAERLMWTHRFEVPAVVDAIEALLDGQVSGLFFRNIGDLTHEQKNDIYYQARIPVERLLNKLKLGLQEQRRSFDTKTLETISVDMRKVRIDLAAAREKAREDIYSRMNSVGEMGAQQEGRDGLIQVDYHGLHVNEMRTKFKEHVLPILPVVGKLMIITGRGSHSAGKESKLKKALFKLIGQYENNIFWQRVDLNEGAIYVLWRNKK